MFSPQPNRSRQMEVHGIFKASPDQERNIRVVLTNGVADDSDYDDLDLDTESDESEDNPDLMLDPPRFTPELQTESDQVSYRFRFPGPGEFQCTVTGLVFVLTQEAELQYETVEWDKSLLQPVGKTPAGPLFHFKCTVDTVSQIHLPHCETKDDLLSGGLCVAQITDDGLSFLEPLEITDTHVIVQVPHLSACGVVWDVVKRFLKPVSSQVLLFLQPPNSKTQKQNLNVLLLPINTPLDEVIAQQKDCTYIRVPSKCYLCKDQSYTVDCPVALKIQPKKATFDLMFGSNYHPTFEICLPINTAEVTIKVQDESNGEVWEHEVNLTGSGPAETLSFPAEQILKSVRTQFVERASEAVLHKLLDKLLDPGVITDGEMEKITATANRAEKARELIDTVRKKGSEASSALIENLCEVDHCLSKELKLVTKQLGPRRRRGRRKHGDTCQIL
ncbi:hypothetical protein Q5P01_004368 [Channa striata]|uniref:Caspase recruitment domain-containing protein 8 n=1 Tax=Channa striata TaxID=64152 RepID=A0AA88NMK0_CHASR|nr:hypothetical protein Q5P01_004368 [Channa striata]